MLFRKAVLICMFSAVFFVLAGCSGSFDEDTGNYSYKGVSLQFPRGWGKIKTTPGAVITVGNREELHQIDVMVQEIPGNVSFERFVKNMTSNYSRVGRKNGSGQMTIGGIEGHWSDWTMTVGGWKYRTLVYAVMKDATAYLVICIAAEDKFPSLEDTFDAVAESVTFG